jgi:hypothetical protein
MVLIIRVGGLVLALLAHVRRLYQVSGRCLIGDAREYVQQLGF